MNNFLRSEFGSLRINLFLMGFLMFFTGLNAQTLQENDKKLNRETNKILKTAEEELGENDFPSAEASYRKAVSKNESSATARYNMANMYYGKEKPAQASSRYKQAAKVAETKEDKHDVFHNLGNSYMDQKKYPEAVEAYKNALRNNPTDEETRYNLALAKKMLEKEQQENKDQTIRRTTKKTRSKTKKIRIKIKKRTIRERRIRRTRVIKKKMKAETRKKSLKRNLKSQMIRESLKTKRSRKMKREIRKKSSLNSLSPVNFLLSK